MIAPESRFQRFAWGIGRSSWGVCPRLKMNRADGAGYIDLLLQPPKSAARGWGNHVREGCVPPHFGAVMLERNFIAVPMALAASTCRAAT